MTRLFNDPATFTEDMLAGFLDANRDYVVGVPGGVVRATRDPARQGRRGRRRRLRPLPGVLRRGRARASPTAPWSATSSPRRPPRRPRRWRAPHTATRACCCCTGNYAGDVMNFGLAVTQLRAEGIDARYLAVTDDVASAPPEEIGEAPWHRRRLHRIPVRQCRGRGGLPTWTTVERVAGTPTRRPALSGWPSPAAPCRAPTGRCSPCRRHDGSGPGHPRRARACPSTTCRPPPSWPTCWSTACSPRSPPARRTGSRVILNGLGRTKYEELFVVWKTVAALLRRRRLQVVRTRGRRTGHQPRHGRLLADGDVARRRARAALDGPRRHPRLPQGPASPRRAADACEATTGRRRRPAAAR